MNEETRIPDLAPALEARVVAFVLGEASDFEREELMRLISQRPELLAFKEEMERVHGDLREVATGEWGSQEDDWKLPAERRRIVEAAIRGQPLQTPKVSTVNVVAVLGQPAKADVLWNVAKFAAVPSVVGAFTLLAFLVSSYAYRSAKSSALRSHRMVGGPEFSDGDFSDGAFSDDFSASLHRCVSVYVIVAIVANGRKNPKSSIAVIKMNQNGFNLKSARLCLA